MPELPEVEAVAQALRPLIEGVTITRCRVIHPVAVQPSPGGAKVRAGEDGPPQRQRSTAAA